MFDGQRPYFYGHLSIPSPMMICRIPITNGYWSIWSILWFITFTWGDTMPHPMCNDNDENEARVAKQSADVFLTSYGTFRCSVAALTRGSPVDPWDEGISWKSADTVQSPCVGWIFLFKTQFFNRMNHALSCKDVEIDPLGLNQMAIQLCFHALDIFGHEQAVWNCEQQV